MISTVKKEILSSPQFLCLSPLTVEAANTGKITLAGNWCLNCRTASLLERCEIKYEICQRRKLSKDDFIHEADLCMYFYNKYTRFLASELNEFHGVNHSLQYWRVLLHRFLYALIASVIDKYNILLSIVNNYPKLIAGIIDYEYQWINPHTFPSFGASHILHLLIFSIIAGETDIIPVLKVDKEIVKQALENIGDGKKDMRSKNIYYSRTGKVLISVKKRLVFFSFLKRMMRGELPLWMFKYTQSNILALGNQYLSASLLRSLLSKAGGVSYCFYAKEWNTRQFKPYDKELRSKISFPDPKSQLELAIQKNIRILLPTVYLENFHIARSRVCGIVPKRKLVILDSQNCSGRELLDFYLAQSMEENKSCHLMIMHGGGYGLWDVSVQEKVWAQISDVYCMWVIPKCYGPDCRSIKMPSLRFHEWQNCCQQKELRENILLLLTGYYPHRYSYNSTHPHTIDYTYEEWQLRFLSAVSSKNLRFITIRDFYGYLYASQGKLLRWVQKQNVRIYSNSSLREAIMNSKLSVATVPSTTFLTNIVSDQPTIAYWNPEANFIRDDLQPFFDKLFDVGILHFSPESAAEHLNTIADDVFKWWQGEPVRKALEIFRNNVCYTSPDAMEQWANYISDIARNI